MRTQDYVEMSISYLLPVIKQTAHVGVKLGPNDPFRPVIDGSRIQILRLVEDGSVRRGVEMKSILARLAVRPAHEIGVARRDPASHRLDERLGHLDDADGADISYGHLDCSLCVLLRLGNIMSRSDL